MKHLHLFETIESFHLVQDDLEYPSVSYIVENESVEYKSNFTYTNELVAGTIVLSNASGNKKFMTAEAYNATKDENGNAQLENGYEAIGIVVIPEGGHSIDGNARMISLKWMSSDSSTGTYAIDSTILMGQSTSDGTVFNWGGLHYADVPLNNFTSSIVIGNFSTDLADEQTTTFLSNGLALLPSNMYSLVDGAQTYKTNPNQITSNSTLGGMVIENNPYDTKTSWSVPPLLVAEGILEDIAPELHYAPSPYLEDGTVNQLYRTVSNENMLSDMDGKYNTEVLVNHGTTSGKGYDAAIACNMFSTIGTNQGDWYLPSIGELGYLSARAREIQSGLNAVGGLKVEGVASSDMGLTTNEVLAMLVCWSSTEMDGEYAWVFATGLANRSQKQFSNLYPAVAFSIVQ